MVFPILNKNRESLIWFSVLLAVFLGYSRVYYVAIFPGEFLLQSIAILLTLRWLATSFTHRVCYRLPWLLLTAIGLLLWALLSSIWASHRWISSDGLLREFTFVALAIGIWHLLVDYRRLHAQLWGISLAALTIISACYLGGMVLSISVRGSILPGRFGFPFANPNLGGSIVGFAAVIAMAKSLFAGKKRHWRSGGGYALVALFLTIVVLASGSKGALLAVLLAGALLVFLLFARQWWIFCLVGVLALVVAWWFRSGWEPAASDSLQIRLLIWKSSWAMVVFSPWKLLFGWGPGNFFPNFPDFQIPEMLTSFQRADLVHFPHNYFLETLVEYGTVGWFLLLALLAQTGYRAWSIWRTGEENALAILAGLFMLLAHAQVSVAFSYIQVQLWLAIAIAWLAACQPRIVGDGYRLLVGKVALPLLLPLLLLAWKYCCWDFLLFHHDFKKACQAKFPDKVAAMLAVTQPCYENFYTLEWRYQLGGTLVEYYDANPRLVKECSQDFLVIEGLMPKFGLFWLTKAMLLARQGKKEQAEIYFRRFAEHDPFCHHLWRGWTVACSMLGLDARAMLYTARHYRSRYPEDGAPLFGEALALHLLGEKAKARRLVEQVYQWGHRQKRPSKRIAEISAWAKEYLRKSQKDG